MTLRLDSIVYKKSKVDDKVLYLYTARCNRLMPLHEGDYVREELSIRMRKRGYDVSRGKTRIIMFNPGWTMTTSIQIAFSDEDATIVKLKGDPELIKLQKDIEKILNDACHINGRN